MVLPVYEGTLRFIADDCSLQLSSSFLRFVWFRMQQQIVFSSFIRVITSMMNRVAATLRI